MKTNHLLLLMILASVLAILTACGGGNSSEAANTDTDNQRSTQNSENNQSSSESQNNATDADETDDNEPNKTASHNKPDQGKDTSATNTEGKKQAYLNKMKETEKEIEKQRNNLDNHSTYALKGVEGNRFDAWDDLLNDIYDTLEKQLPEEKMTTLRQEQRKWISDRDDEAKQASLKYEGGTQEHLEYTAVKADITKERCYELVEKYMK